MKISERWNMAKESCLTWVGRLMIILIPIFIPFVLFGIYNPEINFFLKYFASVLLLTIGLFIFLLIVTALTAIIAFVIYEDFYELSLNITEYGKTFYKLFFGDYDNKYDFIKRIKVKM